MSLSSVSRRLYMRPWVCCYFMSLDENSLATVKPGDKLYLYGDSFNSDFVIFYRGGPIDTLMPSAKVVSNKIGRRRRICYHVPKRVAQDFLYQSQFCNTSLDK